MQDKYTPNWKKQRIFIRIAIIIVLIFGAAIFFTKFESKPASNVELNTPPPAQQFEQPAAPSEPQAPSEEIPPAEAPAAEQGDAAPEPQPESTN